jgi:hypothetical protein
MSEDNRVFVTTDNDYWNAADGSGFSVVQKKARPLPEVTTAIIEDALEQKLLREATPAEIEEFKYDEAMNAAIAQGLVNAGDNYNQSKRNYTAYLASKEPVKPKEEPVKAKKEPVQQV